MRKPRSHWTGSVRSREKADAANKAWEGHERLESANLYETSLTEPEQFSLSYCTSGICLLRNNRIFVVLGEYFPEPDESDASGGNIGNTRGRKDTDQSE